MRIFLVLICSLALASVALGKEEEKKPPPKKQAAHAGQVAGRPAGAGRPTTAGRPAAARRPTTMGRPTTVGNAGFEKAQHHQNKPTPVGKPVTAGKPVGVGKSTGAGKPAAVGRHVPAAQVNAKPFHPQHLNLPNKVNPAIASVKFQQNRRIQGSDRWAGSNYQVFRNYRSEWHDRDWWGHRYSRVGFFGGGCYYWNAGFWYPAWGYDPGYSYYPYDGPIYGYNNLPPDQVIGNVQAALQQQGYYHGEVDGLLGPLTRAAIADYQRDRGLYITSAIDQPTLASLGMT